MATAWLEAGDVRAEVNPAVGGGLSDLSLRSPGGEWAPMLRRAPSIAESPSELAMAVRVAGLGGRGWLIRHRTPQSAVLECDGSSLRARIRYELSPVDLQVDVRATNVGGEAARFEAELGLVFARRLWCEADRLAVDVRDNRVELRWPESGIGAALEAVTGETEAAAENGDGVCVRVRLSFAGELIEPNGESVFAARLAFAEARAKGCA